MFGKQCTIINKNKWLFRKSKEKNVHCNILFLLTIRSHDLANFLIYCQNSSMLYFPCWFQLVIPSMIIQNFPFWSISIIKPQNIITKTVTSTERAASRKVSLHNAQTRKHERLRFRYAIFFGGSILVADGHQDIQITYWKCSLSSSR